MYAQFMVPVGFDSLTGIAMAVVVVGWRVYGGEAATWMSDRPLHLSLRCVSVEMRCRSLYFP